MTRLFLFALAIAIAGITTSELAWEKCSGRVPHLQISRTSKAGIGISGSWEE